MTFDYHSFFVKEPSDFSKAAKFGCCDSFPASWRPPAGRSSTAAAAATIHQLSGDFTRADDKSRLDERIGESFFSDRDSRPGRLALENLS
jgi:hypothetical protein